MAAILVRRVVTALLCLVALASAAQVRTARPSPAPEAASSVTATAEALHIDSSVPRVALVIGNAQYRFAPVLDTPVRDARAMCARFADLGFDVECVENASRRLDMQSAIGRFLARMKPGAVALFYFAGHGLQDRGENYLLPVDAQLRQLDDVTLEGLPLGHLMLAISGHRPALNLVIIDACRENMVDAMSGMSLPRGFAAVDAPANTMVFYSTAPGRLALDRGTGAAAGNSPFAFELLRQLHGGDVTVEHTFKAVIAGVSSATRGRQVPWVNSSFAGSFCFGKCVPMASGAELQRVNADMQRVSAEKQRADAERARISAEKQAVEQKLKRLETERDKPALPPPPPAF